MKAFVLCAGLGTRLRPLTHFVPKSCIPFLNLPLLSYGWFYLEHLGCKEMLVNSYLFPQRLKKEIESINVSQKKVKIFREKNILGSAGGLFNVKPSLEGEDFFAYLNGDSLFFPSQEDQLKKFKEDFLKSDHEVSFYATGKSLDNPAGSFWVDSQGLLKAIGKQPQTDSQNPWRPVHFTGLALFKSDFLKQVQQGQFHIFDDLMRFHLKDGKYHVFVDEEGYMLEGGRESSLLKGTSWILNEFFLKKSPPQKTLEHIFNHFDPQDQKVGSKQGQSYFQNQGSPLLAPLSVKGLKHLKVSGFGVLGPEVHFLGDSFLKNSILGPQVLWRGSLENKMLWRPQAFDLNT